MSAIATMKDTLTVVSFLRLARDITGWVINKLRSYSVQSPKQIKDKESEFGDMKFSKFVGHSSTDKFEIPKANVENFLRGYLVPKKYRAEDIDQLVAAAKYVSQGSSDTKFFEFVVGEGGRFQVSFVALKAEGDNVDILLISYTVEFGLAPDTSGWGIFKTTKHKDLSKQQREDLESFLCATALKSLQTKFGADLRAELPAEDRTYLEYA